MAISNDLGGYKQNKTRLIRGGEAYFTLLEEMIANAQVSVHLHCYIFSDDETGARVADRLIAAAQRGVQVYLLVDGYASQSLSAGFAGKLTGAGVHFSRFEPLFRSTKFYFGRRLHHKVVVIDGMQAMVGGINVSNRYNDMPQVPAWLDMALYIEGPTAWELEYYCCEIWNSYKRSKVIPTPVSNNASAEDDDDSNDTLCAVRVRRNDWVKNRNQVWRSYYGLFNNASESIVIVCSYFLPGWKFRKKMAAAVKRGVNIKVVVTGLSDVITAKYAERYLYNWMLRNNIEIYEYQKTILHAKLATRDGRWMTIGSYNVNNISAYASIELNLDVRNKPFVHAVQQSIESIISNDCIHITPEHMKRSTNLFQRFLQRCAYEFIKVVLFLFTFYFKRERQY